MTLKNLVTSIPTGSKPLTFAAASICKQCRKTLPDLSRTIVLVPQPRLVFRLRRELLAESGRLGHPAILLPQIQCLDEFAANSPTAHSTVITQERRLLMLVKVLRNHSYLYGQGNPWLLAENLLQLFDELTLYRVRLPADTTEFAGSLAAAYEIEPSHPALLREAQIVHMLWQAWHRQLHEEQLSDPPSHYLQQLGRHAAAAGSAAQTLFVLGFERFLPAEREFLEHIHKQYALHIIMNGPADDTGIQPQAGLSLTADGTENAYTAFLNACYKADGMPLRDRIQQFKGQYPQSPLKDKIILCTANHLEQEVQAIVVYVHVSLAKGCKQIGIVTEDRRLARRLRSLLERSHIALSDATGWALSTTYVGAMIENWLECVERDFPHQAMLDLLKSPALSTANDIEQLELTYRLEHDIILHENIASGIDRYIQAVERRSARLTHFSRASKQALQQLLASLKDASCHLKPLCSQNCDSTQIIAALITSLEKLGVISFLNKDPAGELIIELLNKMQAASRQLQINLSWSEFRNWLGRSLEQHYFSPPAADHGVQLLSLQQSNLENFDALVIAAADEHKLPGDLQRLPFFNDAVRYSLGLPDRRHHLEQQKLRFRRLLENSSSIFISWQKESEGEPVNPCPWVEAIDNFHQAAYGKPLIYSAEQFTEQANKLTSAQPDASVPVTPAQMPAPKIADVAPELIPAKLSVSAHQRLIDCPYRFYTAYVLKLKPLDEIREALQKSDYGNRVHRCLEAFHTDVSGLPGPFPETVRPENRDQALSMMSSIAKKVFTRDIEDNFQHRGWLTRWLAFVPHYVDWQIEQTNEWQFIAAELKAEVTLCTGLQLEGRIDRVEQNQAGHTSLIDYKTGTVPGLNEVLNSEEVQLISYSLLLEHVSEVLYLGVDGNRINTRTKITEQQQLSKLRDAVKNRLCQVMARIKSGTGTPALGDELSCSRCDSMGICRRQHWPSEP